MGLYIAGDFQASLEQSWKTLALEPKFAPAQHTLGLAYEQMRWYEEAIVEFQNARACWDDHPLTVAALGHAYASAGNGKDARAILKELEKMAQQRYVPPYAFSLVYAGLDDRDLAFEWLAKAYMERDVWLVWLKADPRLGGLRSEAQAAGLSGLL